MENEKFLKYYLEIMTATLTDAVVRNVSLQTNTKITEEVIKQLEETIIEDRKLFEERLTELQNNVQEREDMIVHLNDEIANLNTMRNQYENVLHQTQHMETFRNQLLEANKKIEELNKQIEYLQLSPAKKKKVDESKQTEAQTFGQFVTEDVLKQVEIPKESSKDGGTF